MIRLNLGAGHLALRGFTNIDILKNWPGIDIVHDVRKLKELYKDNSVDEILAKDVLEHMGRIEWKQTLQDWVDILKPGGVLKLRVPDFDRLAKDYVQGDLTREGKEKVDWFNRIVQLVFGDQDIPENAHKVGFKEELLVKDLKDMGMKVLKTWTDGGYDLRTTSVKGDVKPLVDLEHDDYKWQKLQILK